MLRNPSQRNRRCFEARDELIGGRRDGLLIGSRKTRKAAENPQGEGKPSRQPKTLKAAENPQGGGKPSRRRKTLKAAENPQGGGKPLRVFRGPNRTRPRINPSLASPKKPSATQATKFPKCLQKIFAIR